MFLTAAAATSLAGQSMFEGAISMPLGGEPGRSIDVTDMLKDGKLRMEMAGVRGGVGATLILDVEHKRVLMLVPERRRYMGNPTRPSWTLRRAHADPRPPRVRAPDRRRRLPATNANMSRSRMPAVRPTSASPQALAAG